MWKIKLADLKSAANESFYFSGKNQNLDFIKSLSTDDFLIFDHCLTNGFDQFIAGKVDLPAAKLILKRDIFGTIPCFFFINKHGECFVDSSIEPLLKLKEHLQINRSFVALFLANDFSDNYREYHSFYEGIYQVPAGSVAFISLQSISFSKTIYKHSIDNLDRDLLTKVSSSLQEKVTGDAQKLAVHVSGGLDSSSLAAISIKNLGLSDAYFCTIRDSLSKVSERKYRDAFAKHYGIEIHDFPDGKELKDIVKAYIDLNAHPPLSFNSIGLQHHLLQELGVNGIKSLVTGYGGDGVIDHGYEYLKEMLANADHEGLRAAIQKLTEKNLMHEKYQHWETFSFDMKYGLTALHLIFQFDLALVKSLDHIYLYYELGGNIQAYAYYFSTVLKQKLFGTDYSKATIPYKVKERKAFDTSHTNKKFKQVQSAALSEINESLFALQKLYGVKMIAPFLDTKVLNESLKYTHQEKFGDGIGRAHFRKELSGYLPDFVRLRYGKSIFDHLFVQTIGIYLEDLHIIEERHLIWEFVNKKEFDKIVFNFARYSMDTRQKSKAAFYIHRVLNLKLWLDYFEKLKA